MANVYYEKDADRALMASRKVGVIGYGSQGHAHALNLKDSGVDVRVGLHPATRSRAKAESDGLTVGSVSDVAKWADVVMVLAPDTRQPAIYEKEIAPGLKAG